MAEYLPACRVEEIPVGTGRIVELGDQSVALFNVGGAIYALDNACPHRLGPLGMGAVRGYVVSCPLHHWQFDVTSGLSTNQPGARVGSYPVRIDDGEVRVALAGDEAAITEGGGEAGAMCLVRYGRTGLVGHFRVAQAGSYRRGDRVVIRTSRGEETGEVLVADDCRASADFPMAGDLLRLMETPDKLQERALQETDQTAFETCRQLLAARQLDVELMDVEQLLDGETIVFYFLGESSPELEAVTEELAQQYAARVQFHSFVERAEAGCGPGCGTEEGAGCGDCGPGGCGTGDTTGGGHCSTGGCGSH